MFLFGESSANETTNFVASTQPWGPGKFAKSKWQNPKLSYKTTEVKHPCVEIVLHCGVIRDLMHDWRWIVGCWLLGVWRPPEENLTLLLLMYLMLFCDINDEVFVGGASTLLLQLL